MDNDKIEIVENEIEVLNVVPKTIYNNKIFIASAIIFAIILGVLTSLVIVFLVNKFNSKEVLPPDYQSYKEVKNITYSGYTFTTVQDYKVDQDTKSLYFDNLAKEYIVLTAIKDNNFDSYVSELNTLAQKIENSGFVVKNQELKEYADNKFIVYEVIHNTKNEIIAIVKAPNSDSTLFVLQFIDQSNSYNYQSLPIVSKMIKSASKVSEVAPEISEIEDALSLSLSNKF